MVSDQLDRIPYVTELVCVLAFDYDDEDDWYLMIKMAEYVGAPLIVHNFLTEGEEDSELPKVLLKVFFWALLKVLLLGKVLFKVLEIVQYPKKC